MNRLAILEETRHAIVCHLERRAPLEEGAFCLLREGKGASGARLLASEPILPPAGAWEVQREDQLRPSAQWLSAVVSRANAARSGLLFVHSHPNPGFPRGLSPTDVHAATALGRDLSPLLDGPFATAVVHPSGWDGVVATGGVIRRIEKIVAVGRTLTILTPLNPANDPELDARQRDALGVVHDRVRSLRVAVVGAGGTGSPTAEQLVRLGVEGLVLIDNDRLDTASNVRRVFGATGPDLNATIPPPKVDVVGRHLERLGLGVPIRRLNGDVRIERVFRELLDADVVIVGTDTHGSRAVVNDLASAYFLPVIDIGVQVAAKEHQTLAGLVAEVRVVTPTTPCLWCRGTIDPDIIRIENLPEPERHALRVEGYVQGHVGEPAPSVVALTVLGSGLAVCALLALLSEEGDVAPSGYVVDGFLGDGREVQPSSPKPECWCRQRIGLGDAAAPSFTTTSRTLPG